MAAIAVNVPCLPSTPLPLRPSLDALDRCLKQAVCTGHTKEEV